MPPIYTRNRSEIVARVTLAQRALDEAMARAESEEDAELEGALAVALADLEHVRQIALQESDDDVTL